MTCPHCLGGSIAALAASTLPSPRPAAAHDRLVKLRFAQDIIGDCIGGTRPPSRNTIIEWIKTGRLRGTQIGRGRNYFIWESSLAEFADKVRGNSIAL